MTQIDEIRNALNIALAKLLDLELALQHRAPEVYDWECKAIVQAASRQLGVAPASLYVGSRGRPIVYARQISIYLMAKHTTMMPRQIAAHFRADMRVGNVGYAIEVVKEMMETETNFAGKVVRAEAEYLTKKNERNTNENDQSK